MGDVGRGDSEPTLVMDADAAGRVIAGSMCLRDEGEGCRNDVGIDGSAAHGTSEAASATSEDSSGVELLCSSTPKSSLRASDNDTIASAGAEEEEETEAE